MTYNQNTHRFRGFKLIFAADWLKFSLIEELRMKLISDLKKTSAQLCATLDWKPRLLKLRIYVLEGILCLVGSLF
jgi:hypothetical protein